MEQRSPAPVTWRGPRPGSGLPAVALAVLVAATSSCTVREPPSEDARPAERDAAVVTPPDGAREDASAEDAASPAVAVFVLPGAPADAPDRFPSDATYERSLTLAYPLDGVLLPPNLGGLEVHFAPGDRDLYELRFEQNGEACLLVYDVCEARGSGCAVPLSDAMWQVLATRRGGGPFALRVRALAGTTRTESAPIAFELTDEPVRGGLYYWTTNPAAIHRYDFDLAHRQAEIYYDESDASGHCVGCHALSRDGRTIAIGYGTEGPLAIVDVASRAASTRIDGQMAAFSPDATQMIVGGIPSPDLTQALSIVRTDGTGSPSTLGVGAAPDWSPDGATLAASDANGALWLFDESAGSWTPRELTDGGTERDQFPSFAPDSEWIAFSRTTPSTRPGGVESHVWITTRSGATPHLLEKACRGSLDSMPRWSPEIFLTHGHRLFWLTFTSDLAYGVEPSGRERRIWMAAFDPGSSELDPSHPPFLLPGQPTSGSSFIPQWTSVVRRQSCGSDGDCREGESCVDGVCVVAPI